MQFLKSEFHTVLWDVDGKVGVRCDCAKGCTPMELLARGGFEAVMKCGKQKVTVLVCGTCPLSIGGDEFTRVHKEQLVGEVLSPFT